MSQFLEVSNITRQFRGTDRAALNNVSFSADREALLTLVGASGSGKTTMLRILAGLENADQGEVCLEGVVLTSESNILLPPERRKMGFVFQNHALFPHLSVRDNVAFGLARSKDRKQRLQDLLKLVGMTGFADRFPHELSGGEQQRVALVRALAPQPSLLLMDEPFSSLDRSLRRELRDETRHLIRQQGATAILVTHDTDDALAVSDRIVVLREGVVQQIGTPSDIYCQPANRYIASTFGPCNFIPRSVVSNHSGLDACQGIEPAEYTDTERWVRPENLALSVGEDPATVIRGVVNESHFHGESALVVLEYESANGETIAVQVRQPRSQSGQWEPQPGDRMNIIPAVQ